MPLDVIRETVAQLKQAQLFDRRFTVVFHAGEPLVPGVNYYHGVIDLIRKEVPKNIDVRFSFQTNGVLINRDWCDLFNFEDVNVGISIDGPEFIHDRERIYRNGKGSFAKTLLGIKCLQQHDIEFHTISVLTNYSLDYPLEIYRFFLFNQIVRCGFNVEEIESIHTKSSLKIDAASKRVKHFFQALISENELHQNVIRIREFENSKSLIENWRKDRPDWLRHGQEIWPYRIISVDVGGNFSTFSPELLGYTDSKFGSMNLGNIFKIGFAEAVKTIQFRKLNQSISSGIEKCRKGCKHYQFCGGGSPSNKLFECGTFNSSETMFCRLHKQIPFEVTLEKFEQQVLK